MSETEFSFEQLIQGLLRDGYGTMDNFLSNDLQLRLRNILLDHLARGNMQAAGIGPRQTLHNNEEIRSDCIRWIEPNDHNKVEQEWLDQVWLFIEYLNLTCYTGLNAFESHYAWYDTSSFYKKHKDQFKSDSGRKYSIVMYLNEAWKEGDGGQLNLYIPGNTISIDPVGGRVVFFESDKIEHEVLPTRFPRLSLTGWMKRA